MKLLESYSRVTGLKIKNQFLLEKFFPLKNQKYITVQSGSGMPGKNYPYYNEVIDLIYPLLKANNIDIIQLGGPEDLSLKNCVNLQGKTDIHQTNFILKSAILHFGGDSWQQHRAGYLNVPVLDIFGTTSIDNHAPYKYNSKSIFLSSHRWGKNPTFAASENPLSISTITPEEIANSIFKILGANISIPRQSLTIGSSYNQNILEWVPDSLFNFNWISDQSIIVRCDYTNNPNYQNFLFELLSKKNVFLINDKEIDVNYLKSYKNNIGLLIFKIGANANIEYVKSLKNAGIKFKLITEETDDKIIADLRLKFLDVFPIEKIAFKTKENFFSESEHYLNFPLDKEKALENNGDLWVRTNKFILSDNKIFLNKAAFKLNISTNSFENNIMPIIDNQDFWSELDHYYIFKQKQNN